MASRPLRVSDPLDRDCIRMNVKTLEERAARKKRVVISDRMALLIARQLRRLLEGD